MGLAERIKEFIEEQLEALNDAVDSDSEYEPESDDELDLNDFMITIHVKKGEVYID